MSFIDGNIEIRKGKSRKRKIISKVPRINCLDLTKSQSLISFLFCLNFHVPFTHTHFSMLNNTSPLI